MRIFPVIIFLAVVSCGSPEKDLETGTAYDSTEVYIEEQTGKDPAGMPCGMKDYKDSANVIYHGSDLKILVSFDCAENGNPVSSDKTEASLQNSHDRENILRLAFRSKKFDTSFVVYKKYFLDSLGRDFLKESVFGTTSFDRLEEKEDFIFTTFIGTAYSDDGMEVKFVFNRKKGIRVISSGYPDMGEEETEE
jgi:hypothetical protein